MQLGVLFAHQMVMSAREAPFVHVPIVHGRAWLSAFLSRVLLRGRKPRDALSVAALFGSTCVSAMLFLFTYPRLLQAATSAPTWGFSFGYGLLLGVVYSLQHLTRCVLNRSSGALAEWALLQDLLYVVHHD